MQFEIRQGDNIATLKQYPDNHFDSIVTDPPYGIAFLGKDWDSKRATETTSKMAALYNLPSGMKHTSLADDLAFQDWMRGIFSECLRVLKPGGYLLAFSAARTYHHMAMAAQTSGFEVRDQLMWIYASGFPKAQDVGKSIHKRQNKEKSYTIPAEDILKLTRIEGDLYQHPDGYHVRKLPNTKGSGAADQYGGGKWQDTYERVVEVDNEWAGWKTALKPSHEPIVMARKPFKGSTIDNVLTHGVGALNIDATRIEADKDLIDWYNRYPEQKSKDGVYENFSAEAAKVKLKNTQPVDTTEIQGRFPSNVLGDIPDYQKYFYCPKVSRKERHCGFEMPPAMFGDVQGCYGPDGERFAVGFDNRAKSSLDHIPTTSGGMYDNHGTGKMYNIGTEMTTKKGSLETHGINVMGKTPMCLDCNKTFNGSNDHSKCDPTKKGFVEKRQPTTVGNNHPTVKPVALMRYLIKLVTPPNGKVLDPFCGSGSTGMAAVELGHEFTGCELDPNYVAISERRIRAWNTPDPTGTTYEDLFEEQL